MSEPLIVPRIPPIEKSDPKVVKVLPPKNSSSVPKGSDNGSLVIETQFPGNTPKPPADPPAPPDKGTTPTDTTEVDPHSLVGKEALPPDAPNDSISPFQGVTYASFILTFCLAGFAAIVVFRKALRTSVKRFSIGAKVLALAYLAIAFVGSFGTYIYGRFLSGEDTSFPLVIPMLSWILVGPAIAVVLNSLLTREDKPGTVKILFDAFTYLVIFGCIVASQIPSLGAQEPLVLSFLGTVFFISPIIRFSTSLKIAKVVHPELQEMFVQILIRSLLFLPLLLPSLILVNLCDLITDDLALLLFNLVTLMFVLMTGLLVVISIDYITQGISADQLVAQKADAPVRTPDPKPDKPVTPSPTIPEQKTPTPVAPQPTTPVSPVSSKTSDIQETPQSVPEKMIEPETKAPVAPSAPATPNLSSLPPKPFIPFEESSETVEFDVEKDDSTVINFDIVKSSTEEPQEAGSSSKKLNLRPSDSRSKPEEKSKSIKLPKAPQPPNTPKTSDSKSRIKPPEKPKKRF